MSNTDKIQAPTTDTCQCGNPAHETRTGDKGNKYRVCFSCAQDWQAVMVRKEDAPRLAELGRSLYTAAAQQAGYTVEDTRPRTTATVCPVYDWCTEWAPGHIDHSRYEYNIVPYGAVHLSESTPKLHIGNDEFSIEQAREKAQQLRQVADDMDKLASQLTAALTDTPAGDAR